MILAESLRVIGTALFSLSAVVLLHVALGFLRRRKRIKTSMRLLKSAGGSSDIVAVLCFYLEKLRKYIKPKRLVRFLNRHNPIVDVACVLGERRSSPIIDLVSRSSLRDAQLREFEHKWSDYIEDHAFKTRIGEEGMFDPESRVSQSSAYLVEGIEHELRERSSPSLADLLATEISVSRVSAAHLQWSRLVRSGEVGSLRERTSRAVLESVKHFRDEIYLDIVVVSSDSRVLLYKDVKESSRFWRDLTSRKNLRTYIGNQPYVQLVNPISGLYIDKRNVDRTRLGDILAHDTVTEHVVSLYSAVLTDHDFVGSLQGSPVWLSITHDAVNSKVHIIGYVRSSRHARSFDDSAWHSLDPSAWSESTIRDYGMSSQATYIVARVSQSLVDRSDVVD